MEFDWSWVWFAIAPWMIVLAIFMAGMATGYWLGQ